MKKLLCLVALPLAAQAAAPVIHSFEAPVSSQIGTPVSLQWNVSNATTLTLNGTAVTGNFSRQLPYTTTALVAINTAGWTYSNSNATPVDDVAGKRWTEAEYVPGAEWKNTASNGVTALGVAPIGTETGTPFAVASTIEISTVTGGTERIPTIYFRRTFNVTAANLSSFSNLLLQLQRDDGAAVYINGTLVARNNMKAPSNPTATQAWAHADLASQDAAIPSNAEGGSHYFCVPTSVLRAGTNVIAIEVKQNSLTSSDLRVNAGLTAQSVTETLATSFPSKSSWKYRDDGSNQGTLWSDPAFDDSAWASGTGVFGYKDTAPLTTLNFGADAAAKPLRYTFRKKFTIADKSLVTSMLMNIRYLDGAVLYLNGTRVTPDSLAAFLGFGAGGVADNSIPPQRTATAYEAVTLLPTTYSSFFNALVTGENTLALDVRISTPADTQMLFDLRLRDNSILTDVKQIITERDTWKYLDGGAVIPSDWNTTTFNDTTWASGKGTLGFEPLDPLKPDTQISFGSEIGAKFITTYFRKKFTLTTEQLAAADFIQGEMFLDDGCAVYVNGTLVYTNNLPNTFTSTTLAPLAVNGTFKFLMEKAPFVAGENTISVEVHQQAPTSSDVYFDMSLSTARKASALSYTLAATNIDGTSTATTTANLTPFNYAIGSATCNIASNVIAHNWLARGVFTTDELPDAATDYQVAGILGAAADLQLNTNTNTFVGKSLTLVTGGELRATANDVATTPSTAYTLNIPSIRFKGGAVRVPSVTTTVFLPGALAIDGLGVVDATSLGKTLNLDGVISGSGLIIVDSGSASATVDTGVVKVSNSSSSFAGRWRVEKGTLKATALGSLGVNPDVRLTGADFTGTLRAAILDVDFDLVSTGTLYLNGVAPKVLLDQTIQFASVVLSNGKTLPVGTYKPGSADLLALPVEDQTLLVAALDNGAGALTGSLVVGTAVNPDTDGDGIPDAYEITTYGNLAQTAGGDFDGDGLSNLAEFQAGTDPKSGASTFKVISSSVDATNFNLSFPSAPGKSYKVEFKNNLTDATWTVHNASVSASAGASTTVQVPLGTGNSRFYRVTLN